MPSMTAEQARTLTTLVASGEPITGASVHPFSGVLTITDGNKTVATISPTGAITYRAEVAS